MIRNLLAKFGLASAQDPSTAVAATLAPAAGDLWSVRTDDGRYGVVKVLAVDRLGVHARLYVQRFDTRPTTTEIAELTVAGFAPEQATPFSIGHMPLSHNTFVRWDPQLISRGSVDEDELEGFRMWQEAEGGYF